MRHRAAGGSSPPAGSALHAGQALVPVPVPRRTGLKAAARGRKLPTSDFGPHFPTPCGS